MSHHRLVLADRTEVELRYLGYFLLNAGLQHVLGEFPISIAVAGPMTNRGDATCISTSTTAAPPEPLRPLVSHPHRADRG